MSRVLREDRGPERAQPLPWVPGLSSDPAACPHALPPGGSLPGELWAWPIWGPVYGCLGAHRPPLEPLLRMHVGPVAGPRVRQSPERVSAGPRPHRMGPGGRWPRPRLPGPVSEPRCPRLEAGVEAESLMGYCEAGVRPRGAPERWPFTVCHRSLDVWIGFSAVEGAAAGPAPQGGAFSLESCQNWLPGEPHPATAERCVRLGPAGQCNTDLCSAPHSYVCELRPGGARGPGWERLLPWPGSPPGTQGPLVTPESSPPGQHSYSQRPSQCWSRVC